MIYLDNAATTLKKPDCVVEAVTYALKNCGNYSRGVNSASLNAARIICDTRDILSKLFNISDSSRIAFTYNATESLNLAIKGLLKKDDHVITTYMEHNSVLRVLYEMKESYGISIDFISLDDSYNLNYDEIEKKIKKNTKAIITTHASNVTGNVVDIKRIGEIAKKNNLIYIVDAAQSAGNINIDVINQKIDILCFTGHKSLYGPQGTGGIYVSDKINLKPLKSGGGGVETFNKKMPDKMPMHLEAGTINCHGLAGLLAGVSFICDTSIDTIRKKEIELMELFLDEIKKIKSIKIYGDYSNINNHSPIVSINIADYDSSVVGDYLSREFDIAVRTGGHCAPLMHNMMGTTNRGVIRFSFSYFNTEEEIIKTIKAIKSI